MKSWFSLLFLLSVSCMPEEDLPLRDVGETPEYFIECYCTPGQFFSLSATTVLPVSEDLEIDFSKEMSVTIRADRNIELYHIIHTLPGSDFVYNYGSQEKLQPVGLDSLYLQIITADYKYITASTAVPSPVSFYTYRQDQNEISVQFYTSDKPTDNYYIYSAEVFAHDSIIRKEIYYLDYSEYYSGGLTEKTVIFPELQQAEKVILSLKRITRANYDYQISLNAANTANQSSITTPVPLKGNLQGALGIFTCYTEDKISINL